MDIYLDHRHFYGGASECIHCGWARSQERFEPEGYRPKPRPRGLGINLKELDQLRPGMAAKLIDFYQKTGVEHAYFKEIEEEK